MPSSGPVIDDLWYKNAIIFCLDVETSVDGNGDGVGDFAGLTRRPDYLAGLGVTCLWLQPFYPSPNQDNGYDVADYYGVHTKPGTLGEFSGFRMDAVPFPIEAKGAGVKPRKDFDILHHMRNFLQWRRRDAILLAGRTCRPSRAWTTSDTRATGCS